MSTGGKGLREGSRPDASVGFLFSAVALGVKKEKFKFFSDERSFKVECDNLFHKETLFEIIEH